MKTPSACALGIFSGRIILIFGIAERLRTLRYPIFTGGVVMANGIYSACFLRKRRRCGESPPTQRSEWGNAARPSGIRRTALLRLLERIDREMAIVISPDPAFSAGSMRG